MSGCAHSVKFQFHGFGDYEFQRFPKGDLFRVGINPYSGKVVLAYNSAGDAYEVADRLLDQIHYEKSKLAELCGGCGYESFIRLKDGDEGIRAAFEAATKSEIERRFREFLGSVGSQDIERMVI